MKIYELLYMQGYGGYIWPAFGVVVSTLIINFLHLKYKEKHLIIKLKDWFKRFE